MGQRSGMSPERLRELIVAHTGSVRNRSLVIGLALVAGAIIGGLTDGLLAASGEPLRRPGRAHTDRLARHA